MNAKELEKLRDFENLNFDNLYLLFKEKKWIYNAGNYYVSIDYDEENELFHLVTIDKDNGEMSSINEYYSLLEVRKSFIDDFLECFRYCETDEEKIKFLKLNNLI